MDWTIVRYIAPKGGPARGLVCAPPIEDLGCDLRGFVPAVDGEGEGGLGDEGVAADHLERLAGGVGAALVVAGYYDPLAGVLIGAGVMVTIGAVGRPFLPLRRTRCGARLGIGSEWRHPPRRADDE